MTLDARRAKIWQALGLGPRWVAREDAADVTRGIAPGTGAGPPSRVERSRAETLHEEGTVEATQSQALEPVPERTRSIATLDWAALQATVRGCTACGLCRTRTQTVFGVGSTAARWLLIGEAPGAEEDARGEPFVGQAGRLLDNMLAAAGLTRTDGQVGSVYIANVIKCRPPGNRNPEPDEVARCAPFLQRQIALLDPEVIVLMGRFAAQAVLGTDATIASLRGRVHRLPQRPDVPVVVTYHPAYLLRNLADKAKSWQDLCLAREAWVQRTSSGGGAPQ